MPLFARLGEILFGILAARGIERMIDKGHQKPSGVTERVSGTVNIQQRNQQMPYDIIGSSDNFGGIGADPEFDLLIGALASGNDALLEALAVSGDGSSEIIGAMRSNEGASEAKKAALQRLLQKNAGAVVQRQLNTRRRYPLGFVPTTVAASASGVSIPSAPQNLFRAERMVIPSDIAFDFGVQDIKVGNTSQLVQAVEVPGAIFSEVAIDTQVNFDTAEIGNQTSVVVRNKNAAEELEFTAAMIGTIAKA